MKTRILLIAIFVLFSVNSFAQNIEAPQLDEIGYMCCEDVVARLDNFMIELRNEPEAKGYVVFYGGLNHPGCGNSNEKRRPRRGELSFLITTIEKHFEFRKFPVERIIWINGGYKEQWSVELWKISKDIPPPSVKPTIQKKDIKYTKGRIYRLSWSCPG